VAVSQLICGAVEGTGLIPDDTSAATSAQNLTTLQILVDNEVAVCIPPAKNRSYHIDGTLLMPTDHEVALVCSRATRLVPKGLTGDEAWIQQANESLLVMHQFAGLFIDGEGAGVGLRCSTGWDVDHFRIKDMRAGIQIVQDKTSFGHFRIHNCDAGFYMAPAAGVHGGDASLDVGRIQSCDIALEVSLDGRVESWEMRRTHIDNCDWFCARSSPSTSGSPPLFFRNVLSQVGVEFMQEGLWRDTGAQGKVQQNVFVAGHPTFDTSEDLSQITIVSDNTNLEATWTAA
jgi:hypothetical protein